MNIEQLKAEHDRITDLYYKEKSIDKETFDKLHDINTLKIMEKKGYFEEITQTEIDNRIVNLEG